MSVEGDTKLPEGQRADDPGEPREARVLTDEERRGAQRILDAMERQAMAERLGRRLFGDQFRMPWEKEESDDA